MWSVRLGGLRELSLHGCRKLTDRAWWHSSGGDCPNLRWLNATGAYKMTDGGIRCLLSTHPALLLYNKPMEFAHMHQIDTIHVSATIGTALPYSDQCAYTLLNKL